MWVVISHRQQKHTNEHTQIHGKLHGNIPTTHATIHARTQHMAGGDTYIIIKYPLKSASFSPLSHPAQAFAANDCPSVLTWVYQEPHWVAHGCGPTQLLQHALISSPSPSGWSGLWTWEQMKGTVISQSSLICDWKWEIQKCLSRFIPHWIKGVPLGLRFKMPTFHSATRVVTDYF